MKFSWQYTFVHKVFQSNVSAIYIVLLLGRALLTPGGTSVPFYFPGAVLPLKFKKKNLLVIYDTSSICMASTAPQVNDLLSMLSKTATTWMEHHYLQFRRANFTAWPWNENEALCRLLENHGGLKTWGILNRRGMALVCNDLKQFKFKSRVVKVP
jgi:hypothetical protein